MKTIRIDSRLLAAAAFAGTALFAASGRADDTADAPKPSELETAVQNTIFAGDWESRLYDDVQKWKTDNNVPIGVGAWHWWHMNRHAPHDLHYGLPTLGGTYYWYLTADPHTDESDGTTPVGLHVDLRARDGEERFRPFFESKLWLWEAYVWMKTCDGTKLEAGKIWRRFGLDWDGSWYGNVAYFDGWKLDPDWGVSAEKTFDVTDKVKAQSFLQFFVGEDRVNGQIGGGDPESDPRSREHITGLVRTVPTMTLDDGSTLALGLSYQAQKIHNRDRSDNSSTAAAADLTWSKGPYKAFGEIMRSIGTRNAANYVTGGPSNESQDWMLGAQYQWRFATFRANVSHGAYNNPGGDQVFYLLGVTLAVTKNIDFYIEYVKWDTQVQGQSPHVHFEDGINFILNWRF